jgi:hypothetical protein
MTHKEYFNLLNNPLWIKFRHIILSKKGYKCEQCGSKKTLAIHHPYYEQDKNPWDYKPEEMEILCRRCHYKHHFSDLKKPSDSMKHRMFIIKRLSKEYDGLEICKLRDDFKKEFPNTSIYEAITILNNQKVTHISNGKVYSSPLYWVK